MREFTGPWSDADANWDRFPGVKARLVGDDFADDGTFWMQFSDFAQQFNQVFAVLDFPDGWSGRRYRVRCARVRARAHTTARSRRRAGPVEGGRRGVWRGRVPQL